MRGRPVLVRLSPDLTLAAINVLALQRDGFRRPHACLVEELETRAMADGLRR
jgi:hypothetical protein